MKERFFKIDRRILHISVLVAAVLLLIGSTFAWYTVSKQEAKSKAVQVAEPYQLTLRDAGDQVLMQIPLGNLFLGKTKQVVYSVSGKDAEGTVKSAFDYAMELIYTENLPLKYQIFQLSATTEEHKDEPGVIAAYYTDEQTSQREIRYFTKLLPALTGRDLSAQRRTEAGVTDVIINRGVYTEYTKDASDNNLHLGITDADCMQYFVLEIEWEDVTVNISKYEKETDMIYLVAKSLDQMNGN